MKYVIRRNTEKGGYVTPPGSQQAYTPNIAGAWKFSSLKEAQAMCCDDEVAEPIRGVW